MSTVAPTIEASPAREWPLVVLRGVGQIMFQEHAATGALFLVGIAITSLWMLAGALVAAIVGPVAARLLRIDRAEIAAGLYGFNATLVGIALLFYLEPRPLTWLFVLGGSVLSVFVTWAFRRGLPFPTYTAPFVLSAWACLLLAGQMAPDLHRPPPEPSHTPVNFAEEVLAGEAEVMFGAGAAPGACFLLGIAISNVRHAVAALAGSVIGTLAATYRHDPESSIWIGLYGYNASLAAMAAYLARPGLLAPALAAIATVPIVDWAFAAWGVPALTAPFVLAAWLVLLLIAVERPLAAPAHDGS